MLFNPIKLREKGFSSEMLKFYLSSEYDPKRPMGNVASSDVSTTIEAWLVGLQDKILPIISRSREWLDDAIKKGDEFSPHNQLHISKLNWARAICEWLENGTDSPGFWENARIFEEAAWRSENRPWPRNEIINDGLDDYMAFAFQAAEPDEGVDGYEVAIDMYEYWLGDKSPSLKKTLKPREYAYALCLHNARNLYDRDELFAAGQKMLQANLEEKWLGGGQFIRAATWLKIVYWQNNQALTPLETILKAYDNMPNVERPDFLSALTAS
ncbi:MAG TPA: hypothetical protein VN030_06045 [Cellvibrio sp.]|nr:hypothetical protein [Cellvibrio sp.]